MIILSQDQHLLFNFGSGCALLVGYEFESEPDKQWEIKCFTPADTGDNYGVLGFYKYQDDCDNVINAIMRALSDGQIIYEMP